MSDDVIRCECCDGRGWHPPEGKTADQVRAERRDAPRRVAARERLAADIARRQEQGTMPEFPAFGPRPGLHPVPDEAT